MIFSCLGYTERGVGLYQALMELNFYCPDEISTELAPEDRLAIFEQFWDCGEPRFGDQGSAGWKNVLKRRLVPDEDEAEPEPSSDGFEDRLISEAAGGEFSKPDLWCQMEAHRF